MAHILLLNGPNLNRLGLREPELYGHSTLPEVEKALAAYATTRGHQLFCFQSNHEGALIDCIHTAADPSSPTSPSKASVCTNAQFILFNPAAFTHTSIALRDALLSVAIPFIEIHLTNIYQRETFRQTSYFSDIAQGVVLGLGTPGYQLALQGACDYLERDLEKGGQGQAVKSQAVKSQPADQQTHQMTHQQTGAET